MLFKSIYKSHAARMHSIGDVQEKLGERNYIYEGGLQSMIHYGNLAVTLLQFTPMCGVFVSIKDYHGHELAPKAIISYEHKNWYSNLLNHIRHVTEN